MSHPTHPNDNSDSNPEELEKKLVNLWFAVAVIGLFVFACFYVLKVAVNLFLPIVLASFLGFLLTPVTRWLKKIGFSNFWAPLLGTLSFLFLLIRLFAALSVSLARFEPDFPRYLDHIQERLTPSNYGLSPTKVPKVPQEFLLLQHAKARDVWLGLGASESLGGV